MARLQNKKQAAVTTGLAEHPAFPARWAYGLYVLLCPQNLPECANGRFSQNRPSLDLSPIVLKGRTSLMGSVGQIRCLPSTRTVAWASSPDEQGRELDDGTD
jgi:hypothetical protein